MTSELPDPASSLGHALRLAREVLRESPAGLLTDVDGTISEIAPTPELASVSPGIRQALATLANRLAVVAAISGREVGDVRSLLDLDQLVYVGNHGAQMWPSVQSPTACPAQAPRPVGVEPAERSNVQRAAPSSNSEQLLARALAAFARALPLEGLLLEHKSATASIHYRQCADREAARVSVLETLARLPELGDIVVAEGRLVVNLLPPGAPNKGNAVSDLILDHGLHGAIYLGDDGTDLDAFAALGRLREAARCRTLSIAVANREAPLPVEQMADTTLSGVEEVERFLQALATPGPETIR